MLAKQGCHFSEINCSYGKNYVGEFVKNVVFKMNWT